MSLIVSLLSSPDSGIDTYDVRRFGAIGDGITDDTAAIQAAITACNSAGGGTVVIPPTASYYKITSTLTLYSNIQLLGAHSKPKLKMESASVSRMFDLTGVNNAAIKSLTLDGNKASTPTGDFIYIYNASNNEISDCSLLNIPGTNNGGIYIDGTSIGNKIARNSSADAEGTVVGLIGANVTDNEIIHNSLQGNGGFGIFMGGGGYRNLLAWNRTDDSLLELIGVNNACYQNRIEGNHAQGSGDNGISVTGYQNTIIGNVCVLNDLSGIGIYGSFNTVTGNTCINNNQIGGGNTNAGIQVQASFGGVGQYNTITGNTCDDNQASPTQYNGIRLINNAYTAWGSAAVVTAGSYRYNGLHVYYTSAGGTTGVTAPTHTSGSVSDGGVTWTYIRSFITSATVAFNMVGSNTYGRSSSADVYDLNNWLRNRLTDGILPSFTVAALPSSGIAKRMIYVSDGTGNKRLAVSDGSNWRFPDGNVVS